jgi:hypothetical protein
MQCGWCHRRLQDDGQDQPHPAIPHPLPSPLAARRNQLLTTEWLYPHDRHFTAVPDHGSTRGMGARYAAIVRGCSLQALLLIAILAAPTSPADSGSPYLAQLASQHSGPTPSWEVTHLGKTTRKVGNHRN